MSSRRMKVSKCPSDTLTMTNRAIVNPRDFDKQVTFLTEIFHLLAKNDQNTNYEMSQSCPHIDVRTGPGQHFVFTVETDEKVTAGTVAFSLPQRKWATLSLNQVSALPTDKLGHNSNIDISIGN